MSPRRDRALRGEGRPGGRRWPLAVLAGLLLATGLLVSLRAGGRPDLAVEPAVPALGRATSVTFGAAEPGRGLARVRAELVQGEAVHELFDERFPTRPAWAFWGPRQARFEEQREVGSASVPGLTSGTATLRLSAWRAGTWLRGRRPQVRELELPVKLAPPSLAVESTFHYAAQGGAELVVYRVGAGAVRDGVEAGEAFFRGRPLAGGDDGRRYALFGVPWNVDDPAAVRLVAEDEVGNRASVAFIDRFTPRPPAHDTIRLDDRFLEKVVGEIFDRTEGLTDRGDRLANYLQINGELRRRNDEELQRLGAASPDGFTWEEHFLPMRNAQVMSRFADQRTYVYEGENVDQQTHLGFDLASVERDPVQAANRGRVVLARYFGIYGNTVVLDHGSGLLSLYGHLSSIAVQEGQDVERGAILGRTGATGLAGGDHLHFTMLVGGTAVTPVEWWDDHWIEDRLRRKLPEAWPRTAGGVDAEAPGSAELAEGQVGGGGSAR